jgi:tRNA uridine 5-carbamoylmethylation protein Kti12
MESACRPEVRTRVLLVGGAPLSGKTTLARHIATMLDWDHLHGDDLAAAARTFAPDLLRSILDPMRGYDWREYYLAKPLDEQVKSALAAHRAAWPAFEPQREARGIAS